MRDPWLEGNNIVNLGSFLLLEKQRYPEGPGKPALAGYDLLAQPAERALLRILGPGQQFSQEALLFALCGATHNLHIFLCA